MASPPRVVSASPSAQHEVTVAALRAAFASVPCQQPIRLAKPTTNLFRPRLPGHTAGLDVSGLQDVLTVDPSARTADVQGMCTYETLVAATLPHGLMPKVVPQLKSITLGGAVTGLGIESSSFRNGLPHESVIEMDILTGAGDIVTASRETHSDLFRAFANSYGSLGYALRLRIDLDEVAPFVALRHVQFDDLTAVADAITAICADRAWLGEAVDFLDGVVFGEHEAYLTLGRWARSPADAGTSGASDYTGAAIYYRSVRERERDCLTVHDYLWRWDTDWFWCSSAFGVQNPYIRRVWPRRYRRSDVYRRLVGLDHRFQVGARIDAVRGIGARERVVQDVEVPVERLAQFLRWFDTEVGMRPVWLCPLVLAEGAPGERPWPLYPLRAGELYVNVGFWGSVVIAPGHEDGDMNRAIERRVSELDGHKSLYSDAYYDRDTFDAIYGEASRRAVQDRYDPAHRLTGLFEKAVNRS